MSEWLETVEQTSQKIASKAVDPLHAQFTCEHEWGKIQHLYESHEIGQACKKCRLILLVMVSPDGRPIEGTSRTVRHGERV